MLLLHSHAIESSIRRIGEEILQRAEEAAPSLLSIEHWQQRAMDWLTGDEDLKLRLFRFIEIVPRLRTTPEIARHLREQLLSGGNGRTGIPPVLEFALAFGREDSTHARLVARLARWGCLQSARRFICGSTPAEAIASVLKLRAQGMAFTLDLLGESTLDARSARAQQETYIRLITELGRVAGGWSPRPLIDEAPWGSIPRVNVSIKLTAIAEGFGGEQPAAARGLVLERLRPILRCAREHRALINIDMEHYAVKDLTLDIFKSVLTAPEFRDWPDCGIVIQAYLRDAETDMVELVAWARSRGVPITVRLVKGAYWDSEVARARAEGRRPPVWEEKWESDACFERLSQTMLDNVDIIRPALGSHNVRSIAAALAYQEHRGLAPRTLEMQMLTGMGDPLKRALVSMQQRVRVYSPFGDLIPGMAYLIRRLVENTANESFLRQTFFERASYDRLLADPAAGRRPSGKLHAAPR